MMPDSAGSPAYGMVPVLGVAVRCVGAGLAWAVVWAVAAGAGTLAEEAATRAGLKGSAGVIMVAMWFALGGLILVAVWFVSRSGGPVGPGAATGSQLAAFLVAVVVAVLNLPVLLSVSLWYMDHVGRDTDGVVTRQHCDAGHGTTCEGCGTGPENGCWQSLRVSAASTGRDLGWVGCPAERRMSTGERVRLRVDPYGLVAPQVAGLCHDDLSLDVLLPVTLAATALAGALSTAVPLTGARTRHRAARLLAENAPVRPEPEDSPPPGWR